jgi:hypothetical protein
MGTTENYKKLTFSPRIEVLYNHVDEGRYSKVNSDINTL